MIPDFAYRWLAIALACVVVAVGGFYYGAAHVQRQWQEQIVAQAKAAVALVVKQGEVTTRVVTRYVDRIQEVKGDTEHIIHEVPVYIPVVADVRLPLGWRLLHDAAAVGAVPQASAGVDVAAPDVAASAAIQGVVDNYGACHAAFEQLSALQAWVREEYEATNGEALGY